MTFLHFRCACRIVCAAAILIAAGGGVRAQQIVAFDSEQWNFRNAATLEYEGRTCLEGTAFLKDVAFEDGVIEVDVIFPKDNTRSYPGINFRIQSERNFESFYIRPHRGGLYPDALQYTPVFNGVSGWQLYSGEGYTAGADVPIGRWIHVMMEIKGSQARVFFDDAGTPLLVIDHLEHGESRGSIGLSGPRDGTAYFSNFAYRIGSGLMFSPPPPVETPPGMLTEWEISQPLKYTQVSMDAYPARDMLGPLTWQRIESAGSGLMDISRHVQRTGGIECIFAKHIINSDRERVMELQLGYSDVISVFLNGRLFYTGSSA